MRSSAFARPNLIGREKELDFLNDALARAAGGNGSAILIGGEPGIGKTRLVEEFATCAEDGGAKVLSAAAPADMNRPFFIFSKALEGEAGAPLFHEEVYTSFAEIFAVDASGILIAKTAPKEEDLDGDLFAGMFSAVQDFVRNSLGGAQGMSLGRLEYGTMKILVEPSEHLYLTAVIRGEEHPDMKRSLGNTVRSIEERHGKTLEGWSGTMQEMAPIQEEIMSLARVKFLVRRDLGGVRLENERLGIADRVLQLLGSASEAGPAVLLLEDLHLADESSLFVLDYVARNIDRSRVLVLGTMRPGEGAALEKTVGKMKAGGYVSILNLSMLTSVSVRGLIDDICSPNDFPDELKDGLSGKCAGNPFFVTEMLRQMMDEGSISLRDGRWAPVGGEHVIPATVEGVVFRRLESLPPSSLSMAEYVSCIGQVFDRGAALSFGAAEDSCHALELLLENGMVTERDDDLEFTHAIFRDVIYASIGERWKMAYHKSIGEYLEEASGDRSEDNLYELARHFSRTREYIKGFDYSFRAGERAEAAFAAEQAVAFYSIARGIMANMNPGKDAEIELLRRLGEVRGLVGEYDGAIEAFEAARDLAEDDDVKAVILRRIGEMHGKTGDYDKALEALDAAIDTLAGGVEYGRACLGKGNVLWRQGEFDPALALFQEAAEAFGESGGTDLGNTLRSMGNIHTSRGEYDSALPYYERSLKAMEDANDQYGIVSSLNNIGIVYKERGELEKALEFHLRSLEIRKKIGDKPGISSSLSNMGGAYKDMGLLDKALECDRQSLEIKRAIGDRRGYASMLNNIGLALYLKGEPEAALGHYFEAMELMETLGDKWGAAYSLANASIVLMEKGDVKKARECMDRCIEIREKIRDRRGIAQLFQDMGAMFRKNAEPDKALEYYGMALEVLKAMEDRFGTAYTLHGMGAAAGDAGDAEKATGYYDEARKIFVELGMDEWVEKCRAHVG